jgi:hypothetical protein
MKAATVIMFLCAASLTHAGCGKPRLNSQERWLPQSVQLAPGQKMPALGGTVVNNTTNSVSVAFVAKETPTHDIHRAILFDGACRAVASQTLGSF